MITASIYIQIKRRHGFRLTQGHWTRSIKSFSSLERRWSVPVRLEYKEQQGYLCRPHVRGAWKSVLSWRMSSNGRPFKPSFKMAMKRSRDFQEEVRAYQFIDHKVQQYVVLTGWRFHWSLAGAYWHDFCHNLSPDWDKPKPVFGPWFFSSYSGSCHRLSLINVLVAKAQKGWAWCWARAWENPLRSLIMLTTWWAKFCGLVGREGVVSRSATLRIVCASYQISRCFSRIFLMTGMAAGFAGLSDATGSNLSLLLKSY